MPAPSNVDERHITALHSQHCRGRHTRSAIGTTNLVGAYRLRCSLFICFDIKAVIIWSIGAERIPFLCMFICIGLIGWGLHHVDLKSSVSVVLAYSYVLTSLGEAGDGIKFSRLGYQDTYWVHYDNNRYTTPR